MKRITYFDPRATDTEHPDGREIVAIVNPEKEYVATLAAITDPAREIPQDSIVVEDVPPEITDAQRLVAIEAAIMDLAGELYG